MLLSPQLDVKLLKNRDHILYLFWYFLDLGRKVKTMNTMITLWKFISIMHYFPFVLSFILKCFQIYRKVITLTQRTEYSLLRYTVGNILLHYEGGPLPKYGIIYKKLYILTCLNFSPLQSTHHLMQYTYWDFFPHCSKQFLNALIFDAF